MDKLLSTGWIVRRRAAPASAENFVLPGRAGEFRKSLEFGLTFVVFFAAFFGFIGLLLGSGHGAADDSGDDAGRAPDHARHALGHRRGLLAQPLGGVGGLVGHLAHFRRRAFGGANHAFPPLGACVGMISRRYLTLERTP